MRGNVRILDLILRAGDDAHPRLAVLLGIALDGGKQDHVVDADHVGLHPVENAGQVLFGPFGGLHDHAPAVLHVVVDLLIGSLAEVRNVAVDEVDPELRHLLRRQRLGQVHGMCFEAIALVDVEKARVREKHHLVAELLQRLANPDGVERGAEGGLREQGDHLAWLFRRLARGGLFLRGGLRLRWLLRRLRRGLCHRSSPSGRIAACVHAPGMRPRFRRWAVKIITKLTTMTTLAMALISGVTPKRIMA